MLLNPPPQKKRKKKTFCFFGCYVAKLLLTLLEKQFLTLELDFDEDYVLKCTDNILLKCMRIRQNLDFSKKFCWPVSIFFLVPFPFLFLSLFIQVATFYSLHPFYQLEKFCSELIIGIIRPANETLIKYYRCIGLFYHKFCTKNWLCFFRSALSDCSQYSKWTVVWKDLSYLCWLLIKNMHWHVNWWHHKWFNDCSKLWQKSTLAAN